MPIRQEANSTKEASLTAPLYEGVAPLDRPDSDVTVDPWAVVALVIGGLILWLALVVNTDLNTLTAGSAHSPETSSSTSEVAR